MALSAAQDRPQEPLIRGPRLFLGPTDDLFSRKAIWIILYREPGAARRSSYIYGSRDDNKRTQDEKMHCQHHHDRLNTLDMLSLILSAGDPGA
jgi:hypothetical protein